MTREKGAHCIFHDNTFAYRIEGSEENVNVLMLDRSGQRLYLDKR